MITQAYSVYDKKTQAYNRPFFSPNDPTAIRSLSSHLNEPSPISDYPDDYQLVHIGSFDDTKALLTHKPTKIISEISALMPTPGIQTPGIISSPQIPQPS